MVQASGQTPIAGGFFQACAQGLPINQATCQLQTGGQHVAHQFVQLHRGQLLAQKIHPDLVELVGLNGLAFTLPDFAAWWDDPVRRSLLLEMSRAIETEPALMGLHPHVMAVGRKK